MSKQIINDIKSFAEVSITKLSKKALEKAKPKAELVWFEGQMSKSMNIKKINSTNSQVVANSNQAGMFETGFTGEAEVTPLLRRWAEVKEVKLGKRNKIDVDYGWTSKQVRKNGELVTITRPNMKKFMFNSIPNQAEVKAELDKVIRSTMRGGTVYG